MIVVKINKEKYFINSDLSISAGMYRKFQKSRIDTIWFDYKVENGFLNLGKYKMIELVSCDFVPPQNSSKIHCFYLQIYNKKFRHQQQSIGV